LKTATSKIVILVVNAYLVLRIHRPSVQMVSTTTLVVVLRAKKDQYAMVLRKQIVVVLQTQQVYPFVRIVV